MTHLRSFICSHLDKLPHLPYFLYRLWLLPAEWSDVCDLLSTDCLHSEQVCIKHRSCTQQYNTIASSAHTSNGNCIIGSITNVCIFLVHTCIREYWFVLSDSLSKNKNCFQLWTITSKLTIQNMYHIWDISNTIFPTVRLLLSKSKPSVTASWLKGSVLASTGLIFSSSARLK